MTKHRRRPHPARELAKPLAEPAEAPLLFALIGDRLAGVRSAAVFFSGHGCLAVALAGAWPGLRVSGFELRESAVTAARQRALAADLGDRAVFARVDPRIGAFGSHDLVVVRYPVSEAADGEGALRAAVQTSALLAVFERPAHASHVARIALGLGLETHARARAALLQVFEAR